MALRLFITLLTIQHMLAGEEWQISGPEGFYAVGILSENEGYIPHAFTVTLSLTYPEGYSVDKDTLRNNLLNYNAIYPPFHLTKEEAVDNRTTYTLEALIPGKHALTFMEIAFKSTSHPPVYIVSDIFSYTAKLPANLENPEKYIAPFLQIETPAPMQAIGQIRRDVVLSPEEAAARSLYIHAHSIPWLGITGLFLALTFYITFKAIGKKQPVKKTLKNRAFFALQESKGIFLQLEARYTIVQADLLFSKLMDTMRFYIEDEYSIMATTKTSEEFLKALRHHFSLSESQQLSLKQLIDLSDMVKFGNYVPSFREAQQAMSIVETFIEGSQ